MTTVVGHYASLLDAQKTIVELLNTGFNRSVISFIMRNERVAVTADGSHAGVVVEDGNEHSIACATGKRRRVLVAGPLAGDQSGNFGARWAVADALNDAGLGPCAVNRLVDAICAGAILVAVNCEDRRVKIARDILDTNALTEIPTPSFLERNHGVNAGLMRV